jgi:single-strand DNA-binding protein
MPSITAQRTHDHDVTADRNSVELVGRLAAPAEERTLPSGDRVSVFRLVVARPDGARGSGVDTVDCAAWTARLRRQVAPWGAGDRVALSGTLRRRFWRSATGAPASRYEVEVVAVRRLRRATMAG